ncbi:transcriptional regulator [Allocoprobacillus halotolerans]|uniref:transcriptional regulator n=1 Tax=Allocoprobacillus halotolerans TaxID=2944914 RepID=UPI0025B56E29|nr:WYL domain-containing protein [Allocoprobacillus halotolerans]
MKESRLFKILYYLLAHKQATAVELAQEFEVSVRTIYRDIDNLSGAGIPVYALQGKGDYLLVETSLPHNHVLYSYILSFGEHVEIIKPQEIREEMHNHLKKLQEKYNT